MKQTEPTELPDSEPRRGDVWEFTTNNGVIVRQVLSVASGFVSYLCNGDLRRCSVKSFKSWMKQAENTYYETETRNA